MSIAIDLHTHTLISGHAYSTVEEYIAYAARIGMEGFAVTDHGPALAGAVLVEMYFTNQHALPRWIDGVFLLRGAEANIINYEGGLDLSDQTLKKIDVCIASFHDVCIAPGTVSQHTAAWEALIANPLVDILGHPGRGNFLFDVDHIVQMCGKYNKLIEINNHTLDMKRNRDECLEIALACKKYSVPLVTNSDAHFSRDLGRVEYAEALLAEIDFPDELILNRNRIKFVSYLKERKPHLKGL